MDRANAFLRLGNQLLYGMVLREIAHHGKGASTTFDDCAHDTRRIITVTTMDNDVHALTRQGHGYRLADPLAATRYQGRSFTES
jgi:hypothetical protein